MLVDCGLVAKRSFALESREMNPRHVAVLARMALNEQIAAAGHIRECDRCSQIFEIAFEEAWMNFRDSISYEVLGSASATGPNAFRVTADV